MSSQYSQYREKLTGEFAKFLNVYNLLNVGQHPMQIDMSNDETYALIIRVLGNYLYTTDIEDWSTTSIVFNDNLAINMNIFFNTSYQAAVETFLTQLNTAFNIDLDNEIRDYIAITSEFTDSEKSTCYEFYGYMSRLQTAMKHGIFKDAIEHPVTSKQTISTYATVLEEFNNYTKKVSSDAYKYSIIMRFNNILPRIASNKKQPDIFFDA